MLTDLHNMIGSYILIIFMIMYTFGYTVKHTTTDLMNHCFQIITYIVK